MQADSLQLPYPLLSDGDLKVVKAYGVLGFEGRGVGRAFFLVDKQGIVRGKWIGEGEAVFPSEVLLQEAQQVAAKP